MEEEMLSMVLNGGLNVMAEAVDSNNRGYFCRQLFQKELTPSDVGKLNRLVIPKKYAIKYFPPISESAEENVDGGTVDDLELVFYDRLMRLWKFRYCYWRSSQSFVFTRGWNRFVKEKELKSNDTISFYTCECRDWPIKEVQRVFMIDIDYERRNSNGGVVEGANQYVGMPVELQLGLGQNSDYDTDYKEFEEKKQLTPQITEEKGFRLFGVQIS